MKTWVAVLAAGGLGVVVGMIAKRLFESWNRKQQHRRNNIIIDTLVLSGGGSDGLMYIGVVRALQERHVLKQIRHFIGVSAGALMCTMLAFGIPLDKIEAYVTDKQLWDHILGTGDMGKFRESFSALVQHNSVFSDSATFADLKQRKHIHLELGGLNLDTKEMHMFSDKTEPACVVLDALCISICQPLLFEPRVWQKQQWVDLGIVYNFPLLALNRPSHAIGFEINLDADTKHMRGNPLEVNRLISDTSNKWLNKPKQVSLRMLELFSPFVTADFLLPDPTVRQTIIDSGYRQAQPFLDDVTQ